MYAFSLLLQFLVSKIQAQTSKITSQSVSAQQLLPQRLKNLNPSYRSYPQKNYKQNWELQSSAHERLFLENLEQLQKRAEKNSREFPLGGPSPCGKTGIAPCRQCTFSLFFFILWYPKSKLRPPKSPPKACLPNSFFPKGSKI